MEKILRHKSNLEEIKELLESDERMLPKLLEIAKTKNYKTLYKVFLTSLEKFYLLGFDNNFSIEDLNLAYESLKSLIIIKSSSNKEFEIDLDGKGAVKIKGEVSDNEIEDDQWMDAFYISLILRKEREWLFKITKDKIKNPNPTTNFRASFNYIIFEYLYSNDKEKEIKISEAEKLLRSYSDLLKPNPEPQGYYYLFLRRYWLNVVNAVVRNNQEDFSEYLYKSLLDHKHFWEQKKGIDKSAGPLNEEANGFISLPLTAFCSMAFDKGMKIEVESDYIPKYLYEGTFLKK